MRNPYRRKILPLAMLMAMLAPGAARAAVAVPTGFVDEQLVGGLDEPLPMAFLPDGRLLFGEQRTGRVRLFLNGHIATTRDPILTVPSLNATGLERGFQGMAVDPGWPGRPYVYFFHNRTGNYNRIVRYTVTGDLSTSTSENLSMSSPLLLIDNIDDQQMNHNGGTLRFGPDGCLYASLGEDLDECGAQDSTKLKGVLLRMDVTRVPAGSGGPVPRAMIIPQQWQLATSDSNARLVYAYGFRNPWRFQIDANTGIPYVADVGGADYEEVNEVRPGRNYGWPFREGPLTWPADNCSEPGGQGHGKYEAPMVQLNHSTGVQALIVAAIYHPRAGTSNWPTIYNGDLFYGDYAVGFLRRLEKSGSLWSVAPPVAGQPTSTEWATGLRSPGEFQIGPDGSLWYLSQFDDLHSALSGSLRRIRYTGQPVSVPGSPMAPLALRAIPNPFTDATRLVLELPHPATVRLAVFDTRGRHLRTLFDGTAAAGETRVEWDGADDRGVNVPPGIYFARVEGAGAGPSIRVLRVR
jgi:glucose/arabinose dehydrogenase